MKFKTEKLHTIILTEDEHEIIKEALGYYMDHTIYDTDKQLQVILSVYNLRIEDL